MIRFYYWVEVHPGLHPIYEKMHLAGWAHKRGLNLMILIHSLLGFLKVSCIFSSPFLFLLSFFVVGLLKIEIEIEVEGALPCPLF